MPLKLIPFIPPLFSKSNRKVIFLTKSDKNNLLLTFNKLWIYERGLMEDLYSLIIPFLELFCLVHKGFKAG
jgi:hypothetical protein